MSNDFKRIEPTDDAPFSRVNLRAIEIDLQSVGEWFDQEFDRLDSEIRELKASLAELRAEVRIEELEARLKQPRDESTCPHVPNCFTRIDEPGPCDGWNEALS